MNKQSPDGRVATSKDPIERREEAEGMDSEKVKELRKFCELFLDRIVPAHRKEKIPVPVVEDEREREDEMPFGGTYFEHQKKMTEGNLEVRKGRRIRQ
jgi:hypothetical protein